MKNFLKKMSKIIIGGAVGLSVGVMLPIVAGTYAGYAIGERITGTTNTLDTDPMAINVATVGFCAGCLIQGLLIVSGGAVFLIGTGIVGAIVGVSIGAQLED